ncbi:MAG: hypothetical protein DRP47_01905 [Candidatus Zixiibacteriota bacterium]|nr:MAG: hypothetical protein DRP47_01905 [candidate division Zixibacteria bacterium]
MNNSPKIHTESTLNTNLNELAHGLVREMAMACRKVAIYGASHPVSSKAVEKPFFAFVKLFEFKRLVSLNLERGNLFAMNVRLKESVFTEEIIRYLQILEVDALLFRPQMSMTDLSRFIGRFVLRVSRTDQSQILSTYLKQSGIDTIEVNSRLAFELFENSPRFRGDIEGDFSVHNIAMRQMGESLKSLAKIQAGGESVLESLGIDFSYDVVRYLLPEKVALLQLEDIQNELLSTLEKLKRDVPDSEETVTIKAHFSSLWKLLDYHPQRDQIISAVERLMGDNQFIANVAQESGDSVSAIKFESRDQIDQILRKCLESDQRLMPTRQLVDAFKRLMRTGQKGKATETLELLMDILGSTEVVERGRALGLLVSMVESIDLLSDTTVFENLITRISTGLNSNTESFEYSEIIWRVLEKCLVSRRYDLVARLSIMIGNHKYVEEGVTVYDSFAIKKVIENINRQNIISAMIDDLIVSDSETAGYIRDALISVGGEQVALGLSQIISHPARHVRQLALKILAELGKDTLTVFSRVLTDDAMFERGSNRNELADAKWYVIRNSIFILGQIKDPEGIVPLRLRINDHDVRVRREIVSTLEKIGGEDACDMLIFMAEDSDKAVRESAVIAVGLTGNEDFAPMLINTMKRQPSIAKRGIAALGRLGGENSREFLSQLLKDDDFLSEMTEGGSSREELRLAAVTALGRIGDKASIEKLREFKSSMSIAQKVLSRSSIHKVVNEILSRH